MSYGFEAYKSDGSTLISSKSGVARLIYSADYAYNYSGTVSVPAFDSNRGYYSYRMWPTKAINYAAGQHQRMADDSSFDGRTSSPDGTPYLTYANQWGPTLSWNNSTKVLTITANPVTDDFLQSEFASNYRLVMVHFK